jgi:hypothetical protein
LRATVFASLQQPHETILPLRKLHPKFTFSSPQSHRHSHRAWRAEFSTRLTTVRRPNRRPVRSIKAAMSPSLPYERFINPSVRVTLSARNSRSGEAVVEPLYLIGLYIVLALLLIGIESFGWGAFFGLIAFSIGAMIIGGIYGTGLVGIIVTAGLASLFLPRDPSS